MTDVAENFNHKIKTNSIKAWVLASRPKTLTSAAVPVMLGVSLVYAHHATSIRLIPALLCFLFAFIMQIDANFINDYFDFVRGNDDDTRLGPPRACAQGWVSLKAMRKAILTTTLLSAAIGLPLVLYGGWPMLLVGAVCLCFCFLYTTSLSYLGLGDILVLIFFGLVPVCCTYLLVMQNSEYILPIDVLITSLACGLVVDTLLILNNYRDYQNDLRAKKITLVVRIGQKLSMYLYLIIGVAACLLGIIFVINNLLLAFILPLIYLLPHYITYKKMKKIKQGKALNAILGETARNIFIYGLLLSLGLILSRIY